LRSLLWTGGCGELLCESLVLGGEGLDLTSEGGGVGGTRRTKLLLQLSLVGRKLGALRLGLSKLLVGGDEIESVLLEAVEDQHEEEGESGQVGVSLSTEESVVNRSHKLRAGISVVVELGLEMGGGSKGVDEKEENHHEHGGDGGLKLRALSKSAEPQQHLLQRDWKGQNEQKTNDDFAQKKNEDEKPLKFHDVFVLSYPQQY